MKFHSKISASWLSFSGNVACNGKIYPVREVTEIKEQTNCMGMGSSVCFKGGHLPGRVLFESHCCLLAGQCLDSMMLYSIPTLNFSDSTKFIAVCLYLLKSMFFGLGIVICH